MPGVSIRPSEMVEGGVVPVDRNLTWEECRFALFDYTKRDGTVVATTTAARIKYTDDDGQEYTQHYSVSDPERFVPSDDGKTLVPVGNAQSLNKSSNFFILMTNLVNAGFPENRLEEDISTLDGLRTYNIGIPEPKRSGLARTAAEGEQARERIISVPSQILQLPGEKAKAGAKVTGKKPTAKAPSADEGNATGLALEFVGKIVDEVGGVSRQDIAVRVFSDLAKDPNKDGIARTLFSPAFSATLLANGFSVDGEVISRA